MSRRFGILALVGALFLVTGEARAQAPGGDGRDRPPRHHQYLWRHGSLVRPDRRGAARRNVVGQRLPPELGRAPGLHRHLPFRGHVCLWREGPGGNLRRHPVHHANRPRHAADLRVRRRPTTAASTTTIPSCARDGSATSSATRSSARKFNLLSESRQQPGRPRHPRHGEAADRLGRQRRGHRQDGRAVRLHRQQGNREHGRGLRQHRLPASRRSGRIRSVERHSVRHRRAVPDAQPAEVHDRVVRRDLQQRRRHADGVARARVDHRRSTAASRPSRRTFRCSRR